MVLTLWSATAIASLTAGSASLDALPATEASNGLVYPAADDGKQHFASFTAPAHSELGGPQTAATDAQTARPVNSGAGC